MKLKYYIEIADTNKNETYLESDFFNTLTQALEFAKGYTLVCSSNHNIRKCLCTCGYGDNENDYIVLSTDII